MAKGKCPKCGGDGPFRKKQTVCVACQDKAAIQWTREHPDGSNARGRKWRKNHQDDSCQAGKRNYQKRKTSGKIDAWKQGNREHINFIARVGYWKRRLLMDEEIKKIAKEALAQAREEGMEEDDQFWLAVGAVNHEARKRGVIGEELSSEMNAASQAVVREVKRGK